MTNTNAYHYNEAVRDIKRYKAISLDELKKIASDPESAKLYDRKNGDFYCQELDLTPTYNSEIVAQTLKKMGLPMSAHADAVLSAVTYNSHRVDRAMKTLVLYGEMEGKGYVPIHDITPDMHNKPALLTGKQSLDWLTTTKKDEKVVLVCVQDAGKEYPRRGYKKPRMRTRYYVPQVDADLFVKVID